MTNLVLLLVCFFVGVFARRTRALPEDSHRAVNAWVMLSSGCRRSKRSWKLMLAPAMVLGLMLLFRGQLGLTERVVVAQAAMAPMVTAGVLAADNRLAPGLAAALIAVGVPLSLVTVPLWWHAMTFS